MARVKDGSRLVQREGGYFNKMIMCKVMFMSTNFKVACILMAFIAVALSIWALLRSSMDCVSIPSESEERRTSEQSRLQERERTRADYRGEVIRIILSCRYRHVS